VMYCVMADIMLENRLAVKRIGRRYRLIQGFGLW